MDEERVRIMKELSSARRLPGSATAALRLTGFRIQRRVSSGTILTEVDILGKEYLTWKPLSQGSGALHAWCHAGFACLFAFLRHSAVYVACVLAVTTPDRSAAGELVNSLEMRFRLVEPGEFLFGTPAEPRVIAAEESYARSQGYDPVLYSRLMERCEQRLVRLTRPFWISMYEISMADFVRVMGRKPARYIAGRHGVANEAVWPAMSVTWSEAAEFCQKLSELPEEKAAGKRYRLPTEFEWVRAKDTAFERFTRTNWGVLADGWRVWEYCNDWFDEEYYKNLPVEDSLGPTEGQDHVVHALVNSIRIVIDVATFRVVMEDAAESASPVCSRSLRTPSVMPCSVDLALRWLARHQETDGSWSGQHFGVHCPAKQKKCTGEGVPGHDAGLTGLAVLAFLRAGYLPETRYVFVDPFAPGNAILFSSTVQKGLMWLMNHQESNGCFADSELRAGFMMDHAIATLAVMEACLLDDHTEKSWMARKYLVDAAQKGVQFLLLSQNEGLAWGHGGQCGENDTIVTAWCTEALRAAELGRLGCNPSSYDGVSEWLKRVTASNGIVGCQSVADGGVIRGLCSENRRLHPTTTAAGLFTMNCMKNSSSSRVWMRTALDVIQRDLATWNDEPGTDSCYWYFGARAVRTCSVGGAAVWNDFRKRAVKTLVGRQARDAGECDAGSWAPNEDIWGGHGGRIWTTAVNVLALEVVYGYRLLWLPVW